MTRSRPTKLRHAAGVFAWLVLVVQLTWFGLAFAQDTVPEATEDVDRVNAPQNGGDEAPPPDVDAPADDASEEAADVAAELQADFGIDLETLDPETVEERLEQTAARISTFEATVAELDARASMAESVRDTLAEQVESMDAGARPVLVRPLARANRNVASIQAEVASARWRIERERRLNELLRSYADELESRRQAEERPTERRRESDQAEEEALRALELARERERKERDATVRELLVREREIAEELLALTRDYHETIERIESEAEAEAKEFSTAKARLLADIDEIADDPTRKERAESADPVFSELIELRRETWSAVTLARRGLAKSEQVVEVARDAVVAAELALHEERGRRSQLEASVAERRVAVAQAALKLAEQRLEAALQERDAWVSQLEEQRDRLTFFEETIEKLLGRISSERRARFFSIATDQNWSDAIRNAQERLLYIVDRATERAEQLFALDWTSIAFWAWMWGFLWRLVLALIAVRAVPPLVPDALRRLTSAMMQRRFFRLRPRFTIKMAELLNCLARPVVLYAAVRYVWSFVVATFSEVEIGLWVIDATFAYWILTEVASALVLPRWLRREQGRSSAEELTHLDEAEAAVADLFAMDEVPARKLMRSVKVVVIFWLLATYVPALVEELAGIGVISRIVDRAAVVGLVGIVYWVLSTWRDDIAAIFAGLAKERLPKAVEFVGQHKDRVYGVLIIALASIYVIIVELTLIVRRYLIDTQMFRRASTFAFRKKIEMQAQQREEEDTPEVDVAELPDEYVDLFGTGPVAPGSALYVDRNESRHEITEMHRAWQLQRHRGSVALVGELGIGKTTLMAHLAADFEETSEEMDGERRQEIVRCEVTGRHHRRREVLGVVAEIFELDETPQTKMELVAQISESEPRAILLDDCHRFFMRRIGGFDGFETLLDIVNLTDEVHFWVLSFNAHAWSYMNRVSPREHYFGRVVTLDSWSEEEIQALIETRHGRSDFAMSFKELLVTPEGDNGSDYFHEVVKTARGYFRYLHEFSDGNPRLAMLFWLKSIRPRNDVVEVSLFRRPTLDDVAHLSDDHWFVLTALAQHGALNAVEVSEIVNSNEGFCHLALDFFGEVGVVTIDPQTERAQLAPLYLRNVMRRLMNSNYLYR